MMDNTAATSKWMSLGVPISLDHTSARGQKYACMTALPVEARWVPGECLSFPDMLSRIEQMMKDATALRKAAPRMAAPISYVLPREQGQKYESVARGSKCDTPAVGQRREQKAA